MTTTEILFYIIAFFLVTSALTVVLARNIVYAALALILTLGAVAALYLLLTVEFLALAQLVIYGSAVTMLILFALMLTRARERPQALFGKNRRFAFLATAGLLAAFIGAIVTTRWTEQAPRAAIEPVPFQAIGDVLFTTWAVPVIVVGIVLSIALEGAILLAKREEEED